MGCVVSKLPAAAVAGDSSAAGAGEAERHDGAGDPVPSPSPIAKSPKDASGWPAWLEAAAGDAISGLVPRRADSFEKLEKIGSGTYSNVYKAKDLETGRAVALKKVRFDICEPESVRFMAREITVLRRLDHHPNVVRLEGLATSRVSHALYLVFPYMDHDLAGLAAAPDAAFSLPQVKCYMKQLFSGLEHCHGRGVLHRDVKGSNLLLDNEGTLKIADFGLACTFDPHKKQPRTSRVVTLWYRAPELLLGATHYDVGVDLWSAGCILAELLAGRPILPGRTEVEQLHRIFKLCGSPSEQYWKKCKLPHAAMFKPQQAYKSCIAETFKDFPPHSISLLKKLLAFDPVERGTATDALNSEFFTTKPYACEPSSLPQYPPSKEIDVKLRDEKARRQREAEGEGNCEATKKPRTRTRTRTQTRASRAVPAPEANAELQVNLHRRRIMAPANVTSKSEKFPPPHRDGAVGFPDNASHHSTASFAAPDASFASVIFEGSEATGRKKPSRAEPQMALMRALRPSSIGLLMELRKNARTRRRARGTESEVFGGGM